MYQVAVPDYLRFGLLNCFRLFHAMVHFPTIDRLIELKKPVLIVVGVKDPLISKERMKSALDVLPNLTMVFHTGAAHAVNQGMRDLIYSRQQERFDCAFLLGSQRTQTIALPDHLRASDVLKLLA